MHIAAAVPATIHHRQTPATRRLDRLWRWLAASEHNLTVFCPKWSTAERPITDRSITAIYDVVTDTAGITYQWVTPSTTVDWSYRHRLPRAIFAADPDIVHATLAPDVVLAGWSAARLARVPFVTEWYAPPPDRRLARMAAGRADRTIVPSRLVEERVRQVGGPTLITRVVPTPLSLSRIAAQSPTAAPEILFAGHLDADANVESFLLGLAELRNWDWSAGIIGDGPKRQQYRKQAADLQLADRVHFLGERSYTERIALYRDAHVFVQTATHTPFAHELLLAMACGCVGIAEYHPDSSAHELLVGVTRGFRTTSPEELAATIESASELEHRDIDESFASFDTNRVLPHYLDTYRDVIG